jgi:hypothetical protein
VTPAQDWERDRDGYLTHTTRQSTSAVTPEVRYPPRAILVATPTPVRRATLVTTPTPAPRAILVATPTPMPRATLVSTPTPVPPAVLVSMPTPRATPLPTPTPVSQSSPPDQPVTSKSRLPEIAVSPPTRVPDPVVPAPQNQSPAIPWGGILFFIILIGGGFVAHRTAARGKKQKAEGRPERRTVVFHDYDQYQRAHQLWQSQASLFVQEEAARVAALEAKIKSGGPLSGLGCLGFIVAALLFGTVLGAGAGWGTLIVGVFVVSLISACEQQFRRWWFRDQLKARAFADVVPEPVYEEPPQSSTPPPRQEAPPPRQEPPPPRENRPHAKNHHRAANPRLRRPLTKCV